MKKTILNGLIVLFFPLTMCCQEKICDTTRHIFYELKKNIKIPKLNCDVYIVNEQTKDRFYYLNSEYPKLIEEVMHQDSLYNVLLENFEINTRKLNLIYSQQKNQIDSFIALVNPKLESSIILIESAKENMAKANLSIDNALMHIKKSKNRKWLYASIGVLLGGLTVAALK